MELNLKSLLFIMLKLFILSLFLSPFLVRANALNEIFELYSAPQALCMGNAFTADAYGYLSNYYNPAGLAKGTKGKPEIIIIDVEATSGFSAIGTIFNSKPFATYGLATASITAPNNYSFVKFSSVPAFTSRNFSISLLGNYEYAGLASGGNLDVNSYTDVGVTIGSAVNLVGGTIKLGAAIKALDRTELNGVYPVASLGSVAAVNALMKEGIGVGADIGMMVTIPQKWLPTLGVVWKDALNTQFSASHLLSPAAAAGAPAPMNQTMNAAISIHPNFGRKVKGTIAVEFKHIEMVTQTFTKRFHIGFQLENDRKFYLWLGLNQMYITGGVALRLPGGNLELGTYSQDIAAPSLTQEDRRFLLRYTISF